MNERDELAVPGFITTKFEPRSEISCEGTTDFR